MAKINRAVDNIQVRASSIEENRAILREIQTNKEVDARKQDELGILFDDINAESCVSKSLREKRRIFTPSSFDNIGSTSKPVRYGPLPGCLPGKWWETRVDCSKDRVHEPVDENIHHGPYGAVSICTPNLNIHNDVDLGHVLTFTSRAYNSTSKCTDSLVLSYQNHVPIRLVRCSSISNKYAPRTGCRYDGLYTVMRHWIGVSADTTRQHKFVLSRLLDQEPPPWVNKKVHLKTARLKKSLSRLARSPSDTSDRESKPVKFLHNKVEKNSKPSSVITIVSRQVFDKCVSNSPDTTLKLTLNSDSAKPSLHATSCTNLSLRTNLYDSSHQAQDVKKSVSSVCKFFKPKEFAQVQKAPPRECEHLSIGASAEHLLEGDPSTRSRSASSEEKVKKVSWADACSAALASMEKTIPTTGNGYQYSGGSRASDGFGPTPRSKGSVMKYSSASDYCPSSKMAKHKRTMSTRTSDHASQAHSKVNLSQSTKAHFSAVHELLHETEKSSESTSIDSLAPDELVSVIVKEKYHPMAKLLIGNMIGGLENQEAALVNAYNALTRVNQDDPKQYKLRSKFSMKGPSKKNGILKKQRREIANLTIDAKFDTRSSRSRGLGASGKRILKSESTRRKLLNTRRMQPRNKGMASRENNSKIQGKSVRNTVKKAKKMVTVWTQCSLLAVPRVDRDQQTDDLQTCYPNMKLEPVDSDHDVPQPATSRPADRESCSNYPVSAFAAVSADSNDRITRLRSIGFRPIGCDSPTPDVESGDESSKQDVNEEYNKYTSEENDVVGYMDEQLHFEDIEDEERVPIAGDTTSLQTAHLANVKPQPIETLTEHDFNKPWHGWRKISINGQTYWTGC